MPNNIANKSQQITDALKQRILILDGAMGTMIQEHKLEEEDYRGERFKDWHVLIKGNNDLLSLTQPKIIADIHRGFLNAGADIIETNTFNSTTISMEDYDMASISREVNLESAKLARIICDEFTAKNPEKPRYVAGVLGPTSKTCSISPDVNDPGYRNVTFDKLVTAYVESTLALMEGGADLILIETIFDTLNAKAASFAVEEAFEQAGRTLPVMISGTILMHQVVRFQGKPPKPFIILFAILSLFQLALTAHLALIYYANMLKSFHGCVKPLFLFTLMRVYPMSLVNTI